MATSEPLNPPVPPQTEEGSRHWRRILTTVAILAIAVAWRLIGIQTTAAWRDEAVTLLHLQNSWWETVARLPFIEDSPPLFFLFLKVWSLLFASEWTLRLLALVFGVLTVAMIMKLADRLRPGSGPVAGLLAALSPVAVHYSQELRVYSLLMLLMVLCLWATEEVARQPRSKQWHFLWGLFAVLAAHCHAIGVFVFPATGAYLLVRLGWSRKWKALSAWSFVTWLVGSAPMFWFNLHWARMHKETGWWIDPASTNSTLGLVESFTGALRVMQWIQEALSPTLITLLSRTTALLIYGTCGLLMLAALWDRRTRKPAAGLLAASGTFVGVLFVTSLLGVPNMIDRTLLPAWAPILVLLGIAGAPRTGRTPGNLVRTGSVIVMATLWAVSGGWLAAYSIYERRPASAECFEWVRARLGPDDMVVITPSWLEDSAAWHLRDAIAGEQLFTTDAPAYAGRPPHHTLQHHRITITGTEVREGAWSDRIRQALEQRRGKDFSVWLLCGRWQELIVRDPALKQLESFLLNAFERGERYTPPHLTGIVAQQWVPVSPVATENEDPSPASTQRSEVD